MNCRNLLVAARTPVLCVCVRACVCVRVCACARVFVCCLVYYVPSFPSSQAPSDVAMLLDVAGKAGLTGVTEKTLRVRCVCVCNSAVFVY